MTTNPVPVVGRLAPSPTGAQHVGNARTYLIAWLSARSRGGTVLLRIEDIDSPRIKPGAAEQAREDLRWLGLDWDGEPVVQTTCLCLSARSHLPINSARRNSFIPAPARAATSNEPPALRMPSKKGRSIPAPVPGDEAETLPYLESDPLRGAFARLTKPHFTMAFAD